MDNANNNKEGTQTTGKKVEIIVNGRQKMVSTKELSFDQLVALAFDSPPIDENTIFTVTYRRGESNKPEGTLIKGETLRIKEGMIFNVTSTRRS